MSKININIDKFKYDEIIFIDKHSYKDEYKSNYQRLINILKDLNIIKIEFNKLKIIKDKICIVYNINDDEEEYKEIKHFKKFYDDKFEKHNINIILLNKYDNQIYYINNIIVCHSKLIKELIDLPQFNIIFDNIMKNIKDNKLDISIITNEIIRELLINIIKNERLINICFKDLDKKIIKFFTKESQHLKKLSSIFYLDKTVIIENYKNNTLFNKRKLKIKKDNYDIIQITDKHIKLI